MDGNSEQLQVINLKQLPIIEERLRDVKAKIEQRTSAVMALAVTEEALMKEIGAIIDQYGADDEDLVCIPLSRYDELLHGAGRGGSALCRVRLTPRKRSKRLSCKYITVSVLMSRLPGNWAAVTGRKMLSS